MVVARAQSTLLRFTDCRLVHAIPFSVNVLLTLPANARRYLPYNASSPQAKAHYLSYQRVGVALRRRLNAASNPSTKSRKAATTGTMNA